MSLVIIIAGSNSDLEHVEIIRDAIHNHPNWQNHTKNGWGVLSFLSLSAHKNTVELLTSIKHYEDKEHVIFVTVAGMSNALSGVVASNTKHPVIACPPFASKEDYMIDIHSTLRMPSNVPVLTILSPLNCGLAVVRLIDMISRSTYAAT